MTTDQAIAAVKARGLHLSNLYEAGEQWRANVTRGGNEFWDFGIGSTPAGAIEDALARIDNPPKVGRVFEEMRDLRESAVANAQAAKVVEAAEADDLLG